MTRGWESGGGGGGESNVPVLKITAGVIGLIVMVICAVGARQLWQNVDAHEVCVIQHPVSGHLKWATQPGLYWQGMGKVMCYPKRSILPIEKKTRFNDGGHAIMKGSIQYDMPMDEAQLTMIHTKFGSPEAVRDQLVGTVVQKSVYMTGPLMSSKESYAEKRSLLIWYVEDQIKDGVYLTTQKDNRSEDPLTKEWKTVTLVEIKADDHGMPMRQEAGVLTEYGIVPFNFAITDLDYDENVEKQITQQQDLIMQVQTAIAQSRQAEQQKTTAERQGEANAAKAKWEQETIKAKAVVEANQQKEVAETQAAQRVEVARLAAAEATQYQLMKQRQGAADSDYRKKILESDGALQAKLTTYERVQATWAQAFGAHQGALVPGVVMGNADGKTAGGTAADLVGLLTAKTAKDLSLDLDVRGK